MGVFSTLVPRSNENKSCMRIDKREFVREFSHFHVKREQARNQQESIKVEREYPPCRFL